MAMGHSKMREFIAEDEPIAIVLSNSLITTHNEAVVNNMRLAGYIQL